VDRPLLRLDLSVVRARYRALADLLPGMEIAYAVKANPHPAVLACLAGLGASFDVASGAELDAVLAAGAASDRIEYSHPVKPVEHLYHAYALGVTRYTIDSAEEAAKLAETCPAARVLIRMDVDHAGASWPLADKFGVADLEVLSLAQHAARSGLRPSGVAFHVGSMQLSPAAFTKALAKAAHVYEAAAEEGLSFDEVNIGGGFPSYSGTLTPPPLDRYADAIRAGLTAFPAPPHVTAEPGRYLVADAGTLTATVLGTATRAGTRWAYLDAGFYHGLGETDSVPTRFTPVRAGRGENIPTVLAGPTCDSVDVLYQRTPQMLPADLAAGDQLEFHSTGAYCDNVSTWFNGFPPPEVAVVD